jgi:hypothetical protein
MSVWLVFYHGGSAFHCESFLLGANYLTVLVTAHKALSLLTGIEEGPLAFELFWKSSNDKVDLTDVIDAEHETALELRPAAAVEKDSAGEQEGRVLDEGDEPQEEGGEDEEKKDEEQVQTPKREEKKTRKKRDPNAPKRPKTAYQLFCNDNRAKVRLDCGALSLGEVSAKLAERSRSPWRGNKNMRGRQHRARRCTRRKRRRTTPASRNGRDTTRILLKRKKLTATISWTQQSACRESGCSMRLVEKDQVLNKAWSLNIHVSP